MGKATRGRLSLLVGVLLLLTLPAPGEETAGWVCGRVVDETGGGVPDAEAALTAQPAPATGEPTAAPTSVATPRTLVDAQGEFCFRDLAPGFYELRLTKPPWPAQPPRSAEARAGLVNRLGELELEIEPGEPRVSYKESFDGMETSGARELMATLVRKADAASLQEVARRLLPKRAIETDAGRLLQGIDPKDLVFELLRQLERAYLPPRKSARYIYLLAELTDPRTEPNVVPLLMQRLRDARRLPVEASPLHPASMVYVSDYAFQALQKISGKDWRWKYGRPPLENTSVITGVQLWWRDQLERRDSRRK